MGTLGLEFRILGPLEVRADGVAVPVGGPRQRALLALLLLSANRAVSRDRLVEELMLEPPGAKAERALTVQISRLRTALSAIDGSEPRLVASPPGYVLRVKPRELDLDMFEQLLADGRSALDGGDLAGAVAAFREAEALWRGRPLADLEFEPFARLEAERLEGLRLGAIEERIDAELELGRHAALVPELETLVEEHPLRERLRGQLMLALYRSGRQADALGTYRTGRALLVDQLALEPAPELQELERAILTHDPALRLDAAILTQEPAHRVERAIPAHDPELKPAAPTRPARTQSFHRALAIGLAAGLVMAVAIVVVVTAAGSSSVRLAANGVVAINTRSGQVELSQSLGSPPTSVAVGDGSVWVVSAAAGTLSRLDRNTHDITQIAVGSDPVAVAVAPDGTVWVANSGDGTVSRVSPENDQVVGSPVRVGSGPSALVATSSAVWVANTLNASVSRIGLPSEQVTTISVGSEPAAIAAGDGSIWVANEGDGTVYRLDEQTGAQVAAPIQVGSGPTGAAFGDGAAWVVNSIGLSRIDPQRNSVTETIPVGQGPYDVAAGPGGVWVSDEYGNSIAHVNPATLTVAHTPTSSAPVGLALAGDRLWVATDGIGTDAHRGGVLDALASGINGPGYGDPPTIDPGNSYGTHIWRVLVMTSDGLVGYRRVGGVAGSELVPDLAVALPAPTDNGLTYTFYIRSGIRYSNGVLLRASDFVRGLERAFKLGGGPVVDLGMIAGAAKCLAHPGRSCDLSQGVVADDATNTVTIHLAKPDPDLFAQLTLPVADPVPPGTGARLLTRTVPGTGPYEISSYSPDLSDKPHSHGLVVLKRNPYFRPWSPAAQPAGFPNQIVIHTNYSQAQQVTAVEEGRADFAWDPPLAGQLATLSESFPSQLHRNPLPETSYVWLNVRSTPFSNLLAREAFNYAVDRGALALFSLSHAGASGRPTCQLLPPDFPGYVPYCPYTENLLQAQQLVRESGTGGARVTLMLQSDDPRGLGQELIASLRAIGYHAHLAYLSLQKVFFSPPSFYSQFQAAFVGWAADYVAPAQIIPYTVECSLGVGPAFGNFRHPCHPGLDAKIASALYEEQVNPGLASKRWTAIDRGLVKQAADVPLSNTLDSDFVARRVGDYQHNPQWGVLVDQLWVR